MSKQTNHMATKSTNGTPCQATKQVKRELIKKDFYIADDGRLLFSDIKTLDDIPAGEYYPKQERGDAYLKPIIRSTSYGDETILGSTGAPPLNVASEDADMSDRGDFLDSLVDILDEDGFDREAEMNGSTFIPVHRYFPIEKWSQGIQEADRNVRQFLNQREFYRQLKMDYRRSILLYGDPGTGKSQYLYHLTRDLIRDHDAIVMRVETSSQFDALQSEIQYRIGIRHDRLKVIIIEELAEFISYRRHTELLGLLDSMSLRENVLFLITTNYPHKIPDNIVDRPSRLDLLTKVENSDYDADFVRAWYQFILGEPLSEEQENERWFREVPGKLSPAYLKELFVYSRLHGLSIDKTWKMIKTRKRQIRKEFKESDESQIGFDILGID